MTIHWDNPAKVAFKRQIRHIAEDSIQNAEQVRQDIISIIDKIPGNPEKFPPDKFKITNDGSFRAFEKHSLRIAYCISTHQIRILRVKHVRQEPKPY